MQKITLEEFERDRWNRGEDTRTRTWFWISPKITTQDGLDMDSVRMLENRKNWMAWISANCLGKIFISWDYANQKGRIWFDDDKDAMKYRLTNDI